MYIHIFTYTYIHSTHKCKQGAEKREVSKKFQKYTQSQCTARQQSRRNTHPQAAREEARIDRGCLAKSAARHTPDLTNAALNRPILSVIAPIYSDAFNELCSNSNRPFFNLSRTFFYTAFVHQPSPLQLVCFLLFLRTRHGESFTKSMPSRAGAFVMLASGFHDASFTMQAS